MECLWMVLWVLLVVVAIVDVLRISLSIGKKLLWIILILCLPVLGIVLYYLLGRSETQNQAPSA